MTYQEALDYLQSAPRFGAPPALGRERVLLAKLGNPQERLRFIHVAGTNGKGSTCAAVASVLRQAGYKTGLFTSPYLEDYRERIQIDGGMIPRERLLEGVERLRPIADAMPQAERPRAFELVTALAMDYFARERCDAVVLEVGLGGRFDATNAIGRPLVSVITAVSFDHMAILGDTLEQIAAEKCGIIKPGGLVVSAPGQDRRALGVILRSCAERDATLLLPSLSSAEILEEGIEGTRLRLRGMELRIPLAGRHQVANFATALETLLALRDHCGFTVADADIAAGFAAVRFPARLELLCRRPLVLLDGAHNEAGAAALRRAVQQYLPGRRLVLLLGMLRDKEHRKVISLLAPLAEDFVAVAPDSPRALPAAQAAAEAAACRPREGIFAYEDRAEALRFALSRAGEEGAVLICGSLYLTGEMRAAVRALCGGNFSRI